MIEFAHVNIISDNWKKLADFYMNVFDCIPLLPERDLKGDWLEKATNIDGAHITGIHLLLPGNEDNPPTLEILQYDQSLDAPESFSNRKGFGHIAFRVDSVEDVLSRLLQHGGTKVGELTETEITGSGHLSFVYAKDIDGNIIEIQNWKESR